MTAADRPTVTDSARDEEPLAWCPGCGDRIPTEVIRERGVCSNCYGTSDDPWVTARAEGEATATDEDAARVRAQIAVLLTQHAQSVLAREGMFDSDETSEAVDAILALLVTSRAETTTATDEDMFEQAWGVIARVRDAYPRTVDDAPTEDIVDALIDAGLLATSRTRPTRDDLARAIASGYEPDHPTPNRHDYRAADAVLALFNEKGD